MTLQLKLGVNLGFATNKYVEPHVWTRIVGEELGLRYVQFVADLLNPFLPDEIVQPEIEQIRLHTQKYGIQITSAFTSTYTRLNHLMHPSADQRKNWLRWFQRFADISAALGAKSMGAHLGSLTFTDYENAPRREYVIKEGLRHWRELSWYCKDKGMQCLLFEPMSIPREHANTVEETKELLKRLNEGAGIPFRLCLDVGHAPHPSDRDPYRWIRELGADSPIIHIQQTEKDYSRHWPFVHEYNQIGIIQPERVLEALRASGATEAELLLEIYHRESWTTEFRIIEDHKASVEYWRPYISL